MVVRPVLVRVVEVRVLAPEPCVKLSAGHSTLNIGAKLDNYSVLTTSMVINAVFFKMTIRTKHFTLLDLSLDFRPGHRFHHLRNRMVFAA